MFKDIPTGSGFNHILWISETSLDKLEKFQLSLALPNLKYNCAVLFLKEMYLLFIYASKYFIIDHHYKTLDWIYWYPCKWQNLLNFLQGVIEVVTSIEILAQVSISILT